MAKFPHDPKAFTEGLAYHDSFLYESTGLWGQFSIRKVDLTPTATRGYAGGMLQDEAPAARPTAADHLALFPLTRPQHAYASEEMSKSTDNSS